MSRLFYHVMQDNVGNLLFDVSGTMRVAGSGTLATIYGDEALTVILPNPMTNHPSFASFKCFLGAGDYDFYMAKAGYTFETLTGVQGHGTLAQQDANAVAISGGNIIGASVSGLQAHGAPTATFTTEVGFGTGPVIGASITAQFQARFNSQVGIQSAPATNAAVKLLWNRAAQYGIWMQPSDADSGNPAMAFLNQGGGAVGSITSTVDGTFYNTTSDGRLKDAIAPLAGALDVLRALRPVAFRWKGSGTPGVGFVAQEVAAVLPGVVTGTPEAVDAAGQIVPQQMDVSKLVPWLVGALRDVVTRLEALEARLG